MSKSKIKPQAPNAAPPAGESRSRLGRYGITAKAAQDAVLLAALSLHGKQGWPTAGSIEEFERDPLRIEDGFSSAMWWNRLDIAAFFWNRYQPTH